MKDLHDSTAWSSCEDWDWLVPSGKGEGLSGGQQHARSLWFTFGKGPSARSSRLIQMSCLPFLEKMCCVLPVGAADTAGESPPDSLIASSQSKGTSAPCLAWKPLLLIVPLRLGINQINPVYIEAFKVSLLFFLNPLLPSHCTCQHRDP